MNDFIRMERDDVILEMMQELCTTQKYAELHLEEIIKENPWYLIDRVKSKYGRKYT